MLCISVFMFFESVQANFSGHFGRQADELIHNSRSYVFYVLLCFYEFMFPYMDRVRETKLLLHLPSLITKTCPKSKLVL